jgi:tRNA (guanosine-2'-O-)-methyltransferase
MTEDNSLRFPLPPTIDFKGKNFLSTQIISALIDHISPERRLRLENAVSHRTVDITLVLDGLYDLGNVNALVRSAENYGLQCQHIIESKKTKISKRTTKGADRWVHLTRWKERLDCIAKIKSQGYQIAITKLSDQTIDYSTVDYSRPTAIILGNEHDGVSDEFQAVADIEMAIPTYGLSESFNVSVAGALCMAKAIEQRKKMRESRPELSRLQEQRLLAHYLMAHFSANNERQLFMERLLSQVQTSGDSQ